MNNKAKQRLRQGKKRDKKRRTFLGKEDRRTAEIYRELVRKIPDKTKRMKYIDDMIKYFDESIGKSKK